MPHSFLNSTTPQQLVVKYQGINVKVSIIDLKHQIYNHGEHM